MHCSWYLCTCMYIFFFYDTPSSRPCAPPTSLPHYPRYPPCACSVHLPRPLPPPSPFFLVPSPIVLRPSLSPVTHPFLLRPPLLPFPRTRVRRSSSDLSLLRVVRQIRELSELTPSNPPGRVAITIPGCSEGADLLCPLSKLRALAIRAVDADCITPPEVGSEEG